MIQCEDREYGDEAFRARARRLIAQRFAGGCAPHVDALLAELRVTDRSKPLARTLVSYEAARKWFVDHDEVRERWIRPQPARKLRAEALAAAAKAAPEQLPGVDLDSVDWEDIVRSVLG